MPRDMENYRRWAEAYREKRREHARAWRAANPDKLKKYDKTAYARHRDKVLARNKAWETAHRAERNEYARTKYREAAPQRRLAAAARKYGIAAEELAALRDVQFNRCGICMTEFDARTSPCVDHDHTTGKVRGLLCKHCNFAVGHLRDDPARAVSAAVYLRATHAATAA